MLRTLNITVYFYAKGLPMPKKLVEIAPEIVQISITAYPEMSTSGSVPAEPGGLPKRNEAEGL